MNTAVRPLRVSPPLTSFTQYFTVIPSPGGPYDSGPGLSWISSSSNVDGGFRDCYNQSLLAPKAQIHPIACACAASEPWGRAR